MLKLNILFIIEFLLIFINSQRNNVCKDFIDYLTLGVNKNCWYNPRTDLDIFQIILYEGYSYESHFVTTEDGYIINNVRVKNATGTSTKRKGVIFLLHGLSTDSHSWVIFGKKSLGFFLVDQGYDVWLYNARGTNLSSKHENPNIDYNDYWDFSFHEMGLYDIPASIEHISNLTKSKDIILMGHSMGSTISYIYSILRKTHVENYVKAVISLAPIAYMKFVETHVLGLGLISNPILMFLNNTGVAVFNERKFINKGIIRVCSSYPSIRYCHMRIVRLITIDGKDPGNQLTPENVPPLLSVIGSVMAKTDEHFGQIISTGGDFQYFNYGAQENMVRYGKPDPPLYNLTEITLPIYLIYGENDPFSTKRDVQKLFDLIGSKKKSMLTSNTTWYSYNHISYLTAKDISSLLYPQLISTLNEVSENR